MWRRRERLVGAAFCHTDAELFFGIPFATVGLGAALCKTREQCSVARVEFRYGHGMSIGRERGGEKRFLLRLWASPSTALRAAAAWYATPPMRDAHEWGTRQFRPSSW